MRFNFIFKICFRHKRVNKFTIKCLGYFFERFFVWNYCPLAFLEEGGRNRTPDTLPAEERDALFAVCDYLSRELVRDAEGSSKIFSARVEGAVSKDDARKAARAIASSSLVKAAIHGNVPKWGRVIAAVG